MKVTCLTAGGLTDGWKQSKKSGRNKVCREESAEAVLPNCHDSEGRAKPKEMRVNEGYFRRQYKTQTTSY